MRSYEKFIEAHPELMALLNHIHEEILLHKPENILLFINDHIFHVNRRKELKDKLFPNKFLLQEL